MADSPLHRRDDTIGGRARAEVVYVRCECDEDVNPKAMPCD
jgi:hypothetical protein